MASKSNIRSMRFSDDILEIIEAQQGDTFTAKFENLVRTCVQELPKKKQELKTYQDMIDKERQELRRIQQMKQKFEQNLRDMNWAMESAARQVKRLSDALEGIKE